MVEITRGDTPTLAVRVRAADGSDYELADGDTLAFTVKRSMRSGEPAVIQKVMTAETGPTLTLTERETSVPCGVYVFDVELRTAAGTVCTVVKPSKLKVCGEVTTHEVQGAL